MTWRETASQRTQAELDALLNDSIEASANVFERDDILTPFCLAIATDGSKAMRNLDPSVTSIDEDTNISRLTLGEDRELLRARTIVMDVRVTAPEPTDALKIFAEHQDGQAFELIVPYVNTSETVMIDTDNMSLTEGVRRLWPPRGDVTEATPTTGPPSGPLNI